jgi:metal-responsive CopG/Arc/MetJ family transcriptional regulator
MAKQRVTVTLPEDVAEYADEVARRTGRSRSAIVVQAIENLRRGETERSLAEGYRALAEESRRFAEEALPLAAETWPDYEGPAGG